VVVRQPETARSVPATPEDEERQFHDFVPAPPEGKEPQLHEFVAKQTRPSDMIVPEPISRSFSTPNPNQVVNRPRKK
jgi:hypothetical protein